MLLVLYLGILFDRSIPLRLLKPPFSPFSFPFSFTIFRQDTCAKSKLATYHLGWFRRWALIDLTSFNSSAPTFLSRSPTIPRAEILQEIQVDQIPMWVFNSSVIYNVQCTHAISKGWMIGLWYKLFCICEKFLSLYNVHIIILWPRLICTAYKYIVNWSVRSVIKNLTGNVESSVVRSHSSFKWLKTVLPNSQNFVTWNFLLKQSAVC